MSSTFYCYLFFFFNDTATTEIYTLSLHDALPICRLVAAADEARDAGRVADHVPRVVAHDHLDEHVAREEDRKSTRLNSSHVEISYAVFCLKKKKKKE